MSETGFQAHTEAPTVLTPVVPSVPRRSVKKVSLVRWLLAPVASLRLTVALFALSIALVFFSTLAMVDEGLWTVLHKDFRTGIAWIPFQVFVRFGQVFFGVSPDATWTGSFPFPGGWLLGGLLLVNLLAAHLIRFKISWKRAGILILHSGLIILMLSELVTGLCAVEGRMTISEQQASNYTQDYHAVELAIIDPSDPTVVNEVVIPASMLRAAKEGDVIRDDRLPFDVEVERYMTNSAPPRPPAQGEANPATAGDGLAKIAEARAEANGVGDQDLDIPAAYVTFKKKGTEEALGTYLLSVWWSDYWLAHLLERPQVVPVAGNKYNVFLRYKRSYRPYTVHLLKFRHDVYMGTTTPKNYSSRVRVVDPPEGEDREVLISMNNPLRYSGETFYQSGILSNAEGTETGTSLQVVHNPGWLMPYISCAMVSLGMLLHFSIHLFGFLRRRAAP